MHKTVVFQGDSITDALRNRSSDLYAGAGYATMVKGDLGAAYPGEFTFYNRGISGDRIVDIYARVKADIINLKPDVLSLLIGVNDVLHELDGNHNGVEATKFERVYDMLLTEITEALPDCKIILMGAFVGEGTLTKATDIEPERWQVFQREVPLRAEITKQLARKYGCVYIPLQEVFDAACQTAERTYWLIDGVHPTAMGHALIKNAWLKAYEKLI